MEKIVHSFLKHTYLFQLPVRVVAIKPDGDGRLLQFNDTIFHPQGGGQPNDVGKILLPNQKEYPILSCINDRDTGKVCKLSQSDLVQNS
jgi:Ser-tRNA(Ala) deacylase AlaX